MHMCEKIKPNKQRGVAAVEFAIVLPLLLFLFIGIVEFGIAYYNKQVLTNASREGARAGIVDGIKVNVQDEVYIEGTIKDYALDRLITFGNEDIKDYLTIRVGNSNQGYCTGDDPCNCNGIDYCKVEVTFKHTYLILQGFRFFGAEFGPNLNIGASTIMRMEPILSDSE